MAVGEPQIVGGVNITEDFVDGSVLGIYLHGLFP